MSQSSDRGSTGPANDNLIDGAIRLWQPRMRRDMSREDARQIIEHVTGFFKVLSKWEQVSTAANDNPAEHDHDRPKPQALLPETRLDLFLTRKSPAEKA
jgi:hypothetical protein